ncbi:biopolymer transporter Tol [Herbiconiux sp. P17]|uniref:biopolymer transporter Tol n=1 Tax=Herbiconiux wuyangfengii TaxID=3342794 RepID=UPI0035B79793
MSEKRPGSPPRATEDDERWLVIEGRRWRRTDPALPPEVVDALKSHLGRGRSSVGAARRSGDDQRMSRARHRVDLAKHGLGERGPKWWTEPEPDRLARAEAALRELDSLTEESGPGGTGGTHP